MSVCENAWMGWLRLVGSLKLYLSFTKEPYKRDDFLQKRPIILRSLLTVATPYEHMWVHVRVYAHIRMSHGTHINQEGARAVMCVKGASSLIHMYDMTHSYEGKCTRAMCDICVCENCVIYACVSDVWYMCVCEMCDTCVCVTCVTYVCVSDVWYMCVCQMCDICVCVRCVICVCVTDVWNDVWHMCVCDMCLCVKCAKYVCVSDVWHMCVSDVWYMCVWNVWHTCVCQTCDICVCVRFVKQCVI